IGTPMGNHQPAANSTEILVRPLFRRRAPLPLSDVCVNTRGQGPIDSDGLDRPSSDGPYAVPDVRTSRLIHFSGVVSWSSPGAPSLGDVVTATAAAAAAMPLLLPSTPCLTSATKS
ncbi:hypothetical protein Vafri_21062, partial [Volvox africanus]